MVPILEKGMVMAGYGKAVERKVWYKNYIKNQNMICFKIG
jgi:hypothetical protein